MKQLNNIKLSFWHYQLGGWLMVELVIFFRLFYTQYVSKTALSEHYMLITAIFDIVGFMLTIVLRYVYRIILKKELSISFLLLLILGISFLTAVITECSEYPINYFLHTGKPYISFPKLIFNATWNFPIFFGWSLLYFGIKSWNALTLEKERAAKASFLAQSAQLQMLRYQLNPHFLFNSLNSIWALIDEDKKASKEMVSELAEFLRYSLMSKTYSDVPLKQELEAIKHYFSIEQKRFEEKLKVDFDIEQQAEDFPVLSFLLNPLVENAIKYGMKTSIMPLHICISAKVKGDSLVLQVTNTGKWIEPTPKENGSGTGTGLTNIRLRLENAFPGKTKFRIGQDGDKVVAEIEINRKP